MKFSRRRFLKETAAWVSIAAAAQNFVQAEPPPARMDRVRVGIIGVAGQGEYNTNEVNATNLAEIVALCDVDENRAVTARNGFPRARFYSDYRRMLEQRDIQAVVVATPDHHHAFATLAALRSGRHVYCEKPLTHSVHEGRLVMAEAARSRLVTQMGTQVHAGENYRRVVEIVQAGILGPIERVKVWCRVRPQPGQRARQQVPPPAGLHYDLWLGPAPYRPYHASHLHFRWRWWWDFGGGALADMGCHFLDLPHWALNLGSPTSVAAIGRVEHTGDNHVPDVMQVDYSYPACGNQPAVRLTWYHGVTGPGLDGKVRYDSFPSGVLFEGSRGSLVADYTHHKLLPEDRFRDFSPPPPSLPRSRGHHREWMQAIRQGGVTSCNFAYSGMVSEAVLLGNVAYRAGARIHWDTRKGQTDSQEANRYLRREYRRGWTLET
jgi:predicted dehydrogenase